MNEKNTRNTEPEEVEFGVALGWLAALAVSIASWASLGS